MKRDYFSRYRIPPKRTRIRRLVDLGFATP
jgi:hypothetical protein